MNYLEEIRELLKQDKIKEALDLLFTLLSLPVVSADTEEEISSLRDILREIILLFARLARSRKQPSNDVELNRIIIAILELLEYKEVIWKIERADPLIDIIEWVGRPPDQKVKEQYLLTKSPKELRYQLDRMAKYLGHFLLNNNEEPHNG